jgi:hypothetical protein
MTVDKREGMGGERGKQCQGREEVMAGEKARNDSG